jgi:hypothetical protein
MYYCENLTWNINDIKDNLQIDKAFDIGQLLTHVFWSEQATECFHIARKIHMTSTKIVKSHDVLYDQITCHVYNNLAKFHQNWPLINQ